MGLALSFQVFHSVLLGRLPKVDLIILEGENVRPYVRPSTKSFFDLNDGTNFLELFPPCNITVMRKQPWTLKFMSPQTINPIPNP